jgi:hypothetical protein
MSKRQTSTPQTDPDDAREQAGAEQTASGSDTERKTEPKGSGLKGRPNSRGLLADGGSGGGDSGGGSDTGGGGQPKTGLRARPLRPARLSPGTGGDPKKPPKAGIGAVPVKPRQRRSGAEDQSRVKP